MNLPVCSPAFRRQHLLVAKQFLRIAIAPAKAGTTCRNVRFMGAMREILFRRNLSLALSPSDGASQKNRLMRTNWQNNDALAPSDEERGAP